MFVKSGCPSYDFAGCLIQAVIKVLSLEVVFGIGFPNVGNIGVRLYS